MKRLLKDTQLKEPLLALGFTDKEVTIYTLLINRGEATPATLIADSKFKRGIVYAILDGFVGLHIASKFKKEKKTWYAVEHPQQLHNLAKQREKHQKNITDTIATMLPDLSAQYKQALGKPTVQYFEGESGLIEVFENIYAPKKDIVYGCVDLESADEVFPAYIAEKLIPKRIKNKVIAHTILADSPQAQEIAKNDLKQLRKTVLVDKKEYPLPAEIDIYDDKIAMLSFAHGEFVGLVIENKDLAQTLRSVFKLAMKAKT